MELNRKEVVWKLERLVDKYAENGSYDTYCTLLDSCALIRELTEENEMLKKDTYTTEEVNTIRAYERRAAIYGHDNELKKENEILRRQLEPFKVKQCFTCSFYGVGDDHMPCYACQDYDKYKWLGDDIHVGDRVGTTKGRGVVSVVDNDIVTVELYGDHGIYCFSKDSVWKIEEDEK